jgi:hypothetical protein
MSHQHVSQVNKWGFDDKQDYRAIEYICKECGETYPEEPVYETEPDPHLSHTEYTDGCFGCKIHTLELGTGDAGRAEAPLTAKKWDGELEAYRKARAEGIQPAGTSMKAINEAKAASDNLGTAFNAETMGAASAVTKSKAKLMKETGVA